jgi:hypothetical protein
MHGQFARSFPVENVYRKIHITIRAVRSPTLKQLKNMSIENRPQITPTHNHAVLEAYRTCPFTTCVIGRERLTHYSIRTDYQQVGEKLADKHIKDIMCVYKFRNQPFDTRCVFSAPLMGCPLVDEGNDFYIKNGEKIKSKLTELGKIFRKDNPKI